MAENPSHNEMWVTCPPCQWTWIVAYLPMEATRACKMMLAARCPRCGEHKGLTVASETEIVAATAPAAAADRVRERSDWWNFSTQAANDLGEIFNSAKRLIESSLTDMPANLEGHRTMIFERFKALEKRRRVFFPESYPSDT